MPPKQKKIDPEVQRQQFEEWKNGKEYQVWDELRTISKIFPATTTETTPDLTGKWPLYHEKLMEMCNIFKVKTKLKEFKHEHIRSFFFAREDKEEQKYIIDQIHCSVNKEHADRAWHLRKKFIEIFKALDDISEFTAENYQEYRKKMQKSLTELTKMILPHIKLGHKECYEEKLMQLLKPLVELLEINKRMFMFDYKYKTPIDREIRSFKLKAYVDIYCKCLQECQRILYASNSIVANPDVRKIFNKLHLKDWYETNKIETFYLKPLKTAYEKMQGHLFILNVKGINFYCIPLRENVVFLSDIRELINAELIAERLMGDPLKRDQLNFMYKVCPIIHDANPSSKEYFLKKDDNTIELSIPKMVAYQTILHMRNWLDQKRSDQEKFEKESLKQKQLLEQAEAAEAEKQQQNQTTQTLYLSPQMKKKEEELKKKKEKEQAAKEEQQKAQELADYQRYGRYWMWDNYCTPEMKEVFLDCVEQLEQVNLAVRQDIQDEIIREGMIPRIKERHSKELKEASENLNKMRQVDNSNVQVKNTRPPELWNYPKIVEDKHEFRSIADPKKCYIDGRIESLDKKICALAQHLQTTKTQNWNELVSRIIDAFKGQYQAQPTPFDPSKD